MDHASRIDENPLCGLSPAMCVPKEGLQFLSNQRGETLSEYEVQTLLQLAVETYVKGATFIFSFQGLKRRLGIHQQKLTKALKRLVGKGLIEKTHEGYVLTATGARSLSAVLGLCPYGDLLDSSQGVSSVLESDDPALFQRFAQILGGRWFGDYRFVGKGETTDRSIVEFSNADGSVHVCCCLSTKGVIRTAATSTINATQEELQKELSAFLEFLHRTFPVHRTRGVPPCPAGQDIHKTNLRHFLREKSNTNFS